MLDIPVVSILSFYAGCDKCVSCVDVRMSVMTISAPWSALSGVDILSVQHHLCPDLTWEIFMNLWNNTKSLSLRLVLLTINVVQDIYCKFSRYPWSLNVCTKFDNVFIWWKVSGMFSFHDSEYKLISTRWKQSIKIEPEVYLRWIRDRWVTSPGHFPLKIFPSSDCDQVAAPEEVNNRADISCRQH